MNLNKYIKKNSNSNTMIFLMGGFYNDIITWNSCHRPKISFIFSSFFYYWIYNIYVERVYHNKEQNKPK